MTYIEDTLGIDVAECIVEAWANPTDKTEVAGMLSDIGETITRINAI